VQGTLAYWRFDGQGAPGTALTEGRRIRDLSGKGNDLTVVSVPGSAADALTWSADHHPTSPATPASSSSAAGTRSTVRI
jgi:hypothetical protein